jgi:hypothetical protein
VVIVGAYLGAGLDQVQAAFGIVADRTQSDAAEGRGTTLLEEENVGLIADDDFGAAATVREERDEVALRAAGGEERGFLAEALGGHLLEAVDGGVFGEHVVAKLGRGHRRAHLGRGQRQRVAAQVNRVHSYGSVGRSSVPARP